ncbi:MAG TPA: hypothetical protein VN745_01830 [Verrucomicrobiae bacterium]|nr:hypothetical protein [Verrucomicrobiae bacterium]
MTNILRILKGGDRRSIGNSDAVARKISSAPTLFAQAFGAMLSPDPLLRMRAADAVEKATREHPELLQPFKSELLRQVAAIEQQEVRWHVALMLPRLQLTPIEVDLAVSILLDYLADRSSIERTCAMQGLVDLALQHRRLSTRVIALVESLTADGSAAMRARGRKLLARLKR